MQRLRTAAQIDAWLDVRGPAVLVPTMGALHAGHARLIERGVAEAAARGLDGGCVVSVFVNPTQFDDPADFRRYPSTPADDEALAARAGAAAVFAPPVDEVYPHGPLAGAVEPPDAGRDRGLEDAHRPGHFAGVCQVVRRLFEMVAPAAAVFGEKDWQQLAVIREMTLRDALGVDVIAAPTVREPDGLAMSSRNRFLDAGQRARAAGIVRALRAGADARTPQDAEAAMRDALRSCGVDAVDYAAVRDARTLGPPDPAGARPARALIAARLGPVRLLDNAPWPAGPDA